MKNKIADLSDDALLKKRNFLKKIIAAFGIVSIFLLIFVFYLFTNTDFDAKFFPALVPLFVLPAAFSPLLIAFGQVNKEVKVRNLK